MMASRNTAVSIGFILQLWLILEIHRAGPVFFSGVTRDIRRIFCS